jgi:hypothetical protein
LQLLFCGEEIIPAALVLYIVLIGEPKHLQLVICPLKYIVEFQVYLFIPQVIYPDMGGLISNKCSSMTNNGNQEY